jgi:hypothetical protein
MPDHDLYARSAIRLRPDERFDRAQAVRRIKSRNRERVAKT